MKKLFLSLLSIIIILSSCKITNEVASSRNISKRKHLKGYHLNSKLLSINKKGQFELNEKSESEKIKKIETLKLNLEADNKKELNLKTFTLTDKLDKTPLSEKISPDKEKSPLIFSKKEIKSLNKSLNKTLKPKIKSEGEPGDTAALLSLIFAASGFLFMWLPFVGVLSILLLPAGLIFGFFGLKSKSNKVMAILGLIFSALGLLIFIALIALVAAFLL